MHIAHWGLKRSPFAAQLNPADYYPSAIHEEALARIHFLTDSGRRLGYLVGPSGTGKSLTLEMAARQLRRVNCQVVKMNAVGLAGSEFVWRLAAALGHSLPGSSSTAECWRAIADHFVANRYQRITTVLLLDDADEMSVDLQAALCRLALTDNHPDTRLTLIFAAQPHRSSRFGTKLNELCELRIELEAWDAHETARFVEASLAEAGVDRTIFTGEALDHLFHLTQGVPRRVRQLAELALLAGAAEELSFVDDEVIESVHRSLTNSGVAEAA